MRLTKGTGGEVANAQVCKTCIRGFNSRPVLQISYARTTAAIQWEIAAVGACALIAFTVGSVLEFF